MARGMRVDPGTRMPRRLPIDSTFGLPTTTGLDPERRIGSSE